MANNVVSASGLVIPNIDNLPENPTILSGTQDPTSDAVIAREGTFFIRKVTPAEFYQKTGPGGTDWTLVGAGGSAVSETSTMTFVGVAVPGGPLEAPAVTLAGGERVKVLANVEFTNPVAIAFPYTLTVTRDGAPVGTPLGDELQPGGSATINFSSVIETLLSQPAGSHTYGIEWTGGFFGVETLDVEVTVLVYP